MPLVSASTMKLGDIARSDERVGARVAGTAWQAPQFRSNMADPGLASGAGGAAPPGRSAKQRIAAAARENRPSREFRAHRMRRKADLPRATLSIARSVGAAFFEMRDAELAARMNALWVADITFLPTLAGFLNLAVVLDAWPRRIVGWAFSADLKTRVVQSPRSRANNALHRLVVVQTL
jgi:transposase InsO family protein